MAEFILKDWYGKDQVFDEKTIYVQGKDGELMPFAHGTGNPVIEPLNVTENGTYEVPEGVNGYSPVSVNVPAPEIKLQEKTITENGEYTADSGFDGLGKVTVEVAGSGGGSLPAGVYWEQVAITTPYTYSKTYFEHNGSLCLACNTVSSGSNVNIYKLVDGVWTLMASSTVFYAGLGNGVVEYNGKVHFFQGRYHNIWDGASTITKAASLNLGNDYPAQFVLDGKLYSWNYSNGIPDVWDESTDTWSSASDFTKIGVSVRGAIVQNGDDVYFIYGGLYKLQEDKTWEKISTVNLPGGHTVVHNNKIYWASGYSNQPNYIYAFDLDTLTNKTVGTSLGVYTICLYTYGGKIRANFNVTNLHAVHLIMHEVTE